MRMFRGLICEQWESAVKRLIDMIWLLEVYFRDVVWWWMPGIPLEKGN
jgi:hypothetical protein